MSGADTVDPAVVDGKFRTEGMRDGPDRAISEPAWDGIPDAAMPTRLFGWSMLTLMVAFLVNNVLTFWFGWPGVAPFFGWESSGEIGLLAGIQAALYVVALAVAFLIASRRRDALLRRDAETVSGFNRFFVRAAFWAVLLVGVGDTIISFMRVEGLIGPTFGEEIASAMDKSSERGLYVHVPLILAGIVLGAVTRGLGFIWLALLVVIAELLIVFSRFVFSYEQAFMGDLVRFWYAALFLFASAYTLLEDGHVRVDVFYANMSWRRGKAAVNAWGAILLGMTLCWTILLIGMWSAASLINSPILVWETTQTGFGMYVKYLMAGFLGVFAVTMLMEFVASFFDARADRRGEPGHKEHAEIMH